MLNLLVDGAADVENAAVCPQHSVSAHWGQSGLGGRTRQWGSKQRSASWRFAGNHKSGFLKVQTVKGTVHPKVKTTHFTLINRIINSNLGYLGLNCSVFQILARKPIFLADV